LFGLPFSRNFDVLFYNKDVFDKFAIAYPKDGMTWDETIELGRRVTRQENGVKYEGIYPTHMRYFATQLSLPFINAKTEKPELTTDGWKRVLETYKAISDASGVLDPAHALNRFNRDRTLAMLTHFGARLGEFEQFHKDGNPLNWDMVTYPSFKEKPGISQGPDTHYLLVNSASKHADAAFQVISYLVSDESQIHMAKGGRLSALKNPKINEQFGVNLQTLKGKNVQAIFKSTPASLPDPTRYDTFVTENIQKYVKTYLNGEVDVNTMIRQLEDFVNKEIEVQKKRQ
jgi:multiple sugar transport system substrate-binding protein